MPTDIESEDSKSDRGSSNRGQLPSIGKDGEALGSGSGAGGGGTPEDYDDDSAGGGGKDMLPPAKPHPVEGGDAPVGGSA